MIFLPWMFDLTIISIMLRYEMVIKPSFVLNSFTEQILTVSMKQFNYLLYKRHVTSTTPDHKTPRKYRLCLKTVRAGRFGFI